MGIQKEKEMKLIQEKANLVLNKVEESEEGDLGRAYSEWCENHYDSEELAEFHDNDNVQEPFDKAQSMFIGMFDDLEEAVRADVAGRIFRDSSFACLIECIDWDRLIKDWADRYVRFDVYWFRV